MQLEIRPGYEENIIVDFPMVLTKREIGKVFQGKKVDTPEDQTSNLEWVQPHDPED